MDVSMESVPRKGLLYHPSRGHIFQTEWSQLVELVAKKGKDIPRAKKSREEQAVLG
jgi:hypothetical protein